ncbi:MAG: LysM peptidoglycan-binding domain-containing protein [Spirochaetia bacterium]|jgi:LysM repeat protein|nr:LysM peptidoglycan-binding domain-containing protein [Spirochaetia bacterium]
MKKTNIFILSLILTSFFAACEINAPINEMAQAHNAISEAYAVKADKYAPELLKKAADGLYAAHTACKENKADQAKEIAVTAKNDAEAAIKASWPSLAAETLKAAEDMYAEAEEFDALKAAPEKMDSAAGKIKNASEQNAAQNYAPSYAASLAAMRDLEEAKSLALTRSSLFSYRLEELRKELSQIKSGETAEQFSADIASAQGALESAEKNLHNNKIKTASSQIDEAEEKINALRNAIAIAVAAAQKAEAVQAEEKQAKNEQAGAVKPADKPADKPAEKPAVKPAEKPAKKGIYVVKYFETDKDCLWKIAQKVYRNAALWPRIYIANRDKIKDPDLIFPGQRLIIPDIPAAVKNAQAKRTAKLKPKKQPAKSAVTGGKNTGTKNSPPDNKSAAGGKSNAAPNDGKTSGVPGGGTSGGGRGTSGGGGISGSGTGGGTSSSGRGNQETFLPEGIFRENQ